jgi:hypothetical protein
LACSSERNVDLGAFNPDCDGIDEVENIEETYVDRGSHVAE